MPTARRFPRPRHGVRSPATDAASSDGYEAAGGPPPSPFAPPPPMTPPPKLKVVRYVSGFARQVRNVSTAPAADEPARPPRCQPASFTEPETAPDSSSDEAVTSDADSGVPPPLPAEEVLAAARTPSRAGSSRSAARSSSAARSAGKKAAAPSGQRAGKSRPSLAAGIPPSVLSAITSACSAVGTYREGGAPATCVGPGRIVFSGSYDDYAFREFDDWRCGRIAVATSAPPASTIPAAVSAGLDGPSAAVLAEPNAGWDHGERAAELLRAVVGSYARERVEAAERRVMPRGRWASAKQVTQSVQLDPPPLTGDARALATAATASEGAIAVALSADPCALQSLLHRLADPNDLRYAYLTSFAHGRAVGHLHLRWPCGTVTLEPIILRAPSR